MKLSSRWQRKPAGAVKFCLDRLRCVRVGCVSLDQPEFVNTQLTLALTDSSDWFYALTLELNFFLACSELLQWLNQNFSIKKGDIKNYASNTLSSSKSGALVGSGSLDHLVFVPGFEQKRWYAKRFNGGR